MSDVSPIAHRIYLADVERSTHGVAKGRPRWRGGAVLACLLLLVAAAGRALS
jgi:hypothetical protein